MSISIVIKFNISWLKNMIFCHHMTQFLAFVPHIASNLLSMSNKAWLLLFYVCNVCLAELSAGITNSPSSIRRNL